MQTLVLVAMSAIVGRNATIGLYRQMLRAAKRFNNYNFREYALRRTREDFRKNKTASDVNVIASLIQEAKRDLEVLERQSVINSLYARQHSILELKNKPPSSSSTSASSLSR